MTNLKFNLKTRKILLILLAIAIFATGISNVSAAIDKVQFDPSTPTQRNVDNFIQFRVQVQDSGSPASNVDVDFYYDAVFDDPTIKDQSNVRLGTFKTVSGVASIIHTMGHQSTITYKAVAGGMSSTHTVRYIDPNYKPIQNPGGSNSGGSNSGGSNTGGSNTGGSNSGGSNSGGSNNGGSDSGNSSLSLKNGVIYKDNKAVGFWNGKNAYTLNSAGKLILSSSYTNQIKQAIDKGQIARSNIGTTTTSKIIKFVNNIASNKIKNSAVEAVSKIYTKVKKGTIATKLIAADIAAKNLGARKFSGNNIYLSTNAIKTVLNTDVSKKYIARKTVKANTLKTALKKGKAILRVKNLKSNKWQFIAISKLSNKKVTVFDKATKKTTNINSLPSYLKKKYKFSSGIAITFGVKVGKSPTLKLLKGSTGI